MHYLFSDSLLPVKILTNFIMHHNMVLCHSHAIIIVTLLQLEMMYSVCAVDLLSYLMCSSSISSDYVVTSLIEPALYILKLFLVLLKKL